MRHVPRYLPFIGAGLLLLAAGPSESYAPETAPEALKPAVARAEGAIGALAQTLMGRMKEVFAAEGPTGAIRVCRQEAQELTASIGSERGVEIGRTSHRLRNPANAPRAWVEPFLADAAGAKASETSPVVVDLGDRVGMLKPIGLADLCLDCHGADLAAEVREEIEASYPEDLATGFAAGDLRGFFWVEVPKETP